MNFRFLRRMLLVLCLNVIQLCYFTTANQSSCIEELKEVRSCPRTNNDWLEASDMKKCNTINSTKCPHGLLYQCHNNHWRNQSFEMCAAAVKIHGYACAEYNQKGRLIQPNFQNMCNGSDFEPPCPFMYLSTDMLIYYPCYGMVSPTTTITDEDATSPSNETNAEKKFPLIYVLLPVLVLVVLLILCIAYQCLKNQRTRTTGNYGLVTAEQVSSTSFIPGGSSPIH